MHVSFYVISAHRRGWRGIHRHITDTFHLTTFISTQETTGAGLLYHPKMLLHPRHFAYSRHGGCRHPCASNNYSWMLQFLRNRTTLSGTDQMPEQISTEPGLNFATFSDNGAVSVQGAMGLTGPTDARVVRADGSQAGVIKSNAPKPPFEANLEITKVPVDGRALSAMVIRPREFDAKRKYPVLVHIYGGPHHQMVIATGILRDSKPTRRTHDRPRRTDSHLL